MRPTSTRAATRAGAVCAVCGGAGYLVVGFAHGDLPSDSVEQALDHVASTPAWSAIHLGGIVSILLWAGAIAAIASTLPPGRAAALGRMATIAAVFGAALYTVDYTIDGVGLPLLADAWTSTPDPVAAQAARDTGAAVIAVLDATVVAGTTWAFGPPILLCGLAMVTARRSGHDLCPVLAWIPVFTGGASLAAGLTTYVLPRSEPAFLTVLATGAMTALWLIAIGTRLWRPSPKDASAP